jgi:hypothetical protein
MAQHAPMGQRTYSAQQAAVWDAMTSGMYCAPHLIANDAEREHERRRHREMTVDVFPEHAMSHMHTAYRFTKGDTTMLRKSMPKVSLLSVLVIGTVAFGLVRSAPVAGQDDTQTKIESAMSAAPSTVSANAAILDNELDDAGKFVVLREGSNGWYCSPDIPSSPGNDPQCMDQTWLDWNYAFYAGEEPTVKAPGLEYMLQGGSDPSNTDPLATAPAEGEEWVSSPPHVMILLPGELAQTGLSTDHHSGKPYIMWAGTPYEHIMMPVAEGTMAE